MNALPAMLRDLPITSLLPALESSWKSGKARFVLQAEPGAGKSTGIPVFLLLSGLCTGKIMMLEPRRMAARSLASYIAAALGESPGGTAGYRVRGESRCSRRTRLEIVTEGVFIRMIQEDPELNGVEAVILDEFHERNLFSDMAYAFLRDVQESLRPDLKVLIMSATPQKTLLEAQFSGADYLASPGRMYPVDLEYRESRQERGVDLSLIGQAVIEGLEKRPGDVLVFLPGEGEIRRVRESLADKPALKESSIIPLYGRLSLEEQEKAFEPSPSRKIILATSIAETSLTIPGVTAVVDTGLERRPVFHRHSGLTRLETCRISRASADQRAGRAGRVAEGLCLRLWPERDQAGREAFKDPEILTADLSSLVLETALWGCADPEGLPWLEAPSKAHFYQARELLVLLGALGGDGRLTPLGKEMAALGLSPRLARLVAEGRRRGSEQTACLLAAFLSERDWMGTRGQSDIGLRIDALRRGDDRNRPVVKRILRLWDALVPGGAEAKALNPGSAAELLLAAYPDRIGRGREGGSYHLSGGGSCGLSETDSLQGSEFLLAVETGGSGKEPRIFLSVPLTKELILQGCRERITESEEARWDEEKHRLKARRVRSLGALVLSETPLKEPTAKASLADLRDLLRKKGILILPWQKEDLQYWNRCRFASSLETAALPADWPEFHETALVEDLDTWFAPLLVRGRWDRGIKEGLRGRLSWEQQKFLDRAVPDRIQVPSGSRLRIDYADPAQPALDVRIQELFGMQETPLIGGRIPLVIRLLNPAGRPIQVTRDLRSFWDNTYPSVRKELRGRYSKHYWPKDPSTAVPTHRVRPAGSPPKAGRTR